MSNPQETSVTQIVEDDALIAEALKAAKIPPLIMSIIHLTGDTSLLDEIALTGVTIQQMDGTVSESDKEKVRARALQALVAYRDGQPLAPAPTPQTLKRMADFIASQNLTDDYVAMLTDDLGISPRASFWPEGKAPVEAAQFHTLVIGAGMSGLLQAHRLSEAGLPFTIVEKNDEVGGTWYENRYPGCRVDSSNHFYSYSFEPNNDWSHFYSERDELLAYFKRCADRFGLRDKIRFNTEVTEARFDEGSGLWQVRLRTPAGEETMQVSAIVSAVGQLNRPHIPDFPGRDSFKGPQFHAAAWEDGHALGGKRIAVIGAGATAFQLIPEMAKIASRLVCFQRSPGWMAPNPVYHDPVDDGTLWLLKHVPFYQRWYRFCLFWGAGDGTLRTYTVDPNWPDQDRSINALNARQREILTEAMVAQLTNQEEIGEIVSDGLAAELAKRDHLVELLVPPYPPGGKRMLQDNGTYLRSLTSDHVGVVAHGIREIVADGIIDETGRHHAVDVILYATGFRANEFLFPMRIVGREGKNLAEEWGETARAYLGITVTGFPNLFILYGPGTNLAHGGSIIFHSECQVRYVMACIKLLIETGAKSMEVSQAAYDRYAGDIADALSRMIWSHPGVTSWYKNSKGVVINTSPWRLVDYWNWTRAPDSSAYELADART